MSVPDRSKNRSSEDIYRESVKNAALAQFEGKPGPRDVVFGNPRVGRKDKWMWGGSIISRSDMSSNEYENWVAAKKSEGWTDWKSDSPMSSEDLKQIKQARRKK